MLQFIKGIFIFCILTVLTQVGGIVYLFYKVVKRIISRKFKDELGFTERFLLFFFLYIVATLMIVPPIAFQFGRVALPMMTTKNDLVKPRTMLTCLLNRHYVTSPLKKLTYDIAKKIDKKYPDTKIIYLDANFPFMDGFPLLPHKSHDDGKKLDIAFLYLDAKTKKRINKSPSFYGYGICEKPKKGELDKPAECEKKGYWQYNLLSKFTPSFGKDNYIFDEKANKELLKIMATQKATGKIFIEPHLKTRMGLNYKKIRFHGCAAVRHDDHIHIQL